MSHALRNDYSPEQGPTWHEAPPAELSGLAGKCESGQAPGTERGRRATARWLRSRIEHAGPQQFSEKKRFQY